MACAGCCRSGCGRSSADRRAGIGPPEKTDQTVYMHPRTTWPLVARIEMSSGTLPDMVLDEYYRTLAARSRGPWI